MSFYNFMKSDYPFRAKDLKIYQTDPFVSNTRFLQDTLKKKLLIDCLSLFWPVIVHYIQILYESNL